MIRRRFSALAGDQSGGVLVEFATISPFVGLLLIGLLQVGTLFHAHSAVRSSLGEGARFATLYRTPAPGNAWDGPSAAEICGRLTSTINSLGNANITSLTIQRATNGTAHALALTVAYNVDLDFLFFSQSAALSSTRQVYVRNQPSFGSPTYACTV